MAALPTLYPVGEAQGQKLGLHLSYQLLDRLQLAANGLGGPWERDVGDFR